MCARFQHWTVIGAKIRIKVWKDASTFNDPDPTDISLTLNSVDASILDAFAEREQPNCSYGTVIGGQTPIYLTKGFSAKKFFGKRNVAAEDELRGTSGADPTEQAFFILTATDREALAGESDSTDGLHWEATITFKSVWTERKEIGQS